MMLSRRDFILRANSIALAFPFLSLVGCGEDGDGLHSITGTTMGTSYTVKLPTGDDNLDLDRLAAKIDARLQSVDQLMSTYRNTSEVSLFNADAATTPRALSDATLRVVETALTVAEMTGGAFDPTIGPLVDLWGFGPNGTRLDPPGSADIIAAMARVDYRQIGLSGGRIAKDTAGLRLDLSGIAKGYGVDLVAELLDAEGVENYLVEVGGEVRSRGAPAADRTWRLGIEEPTPSARNIQRVVDLNGHALATSGNYRIFFEADGQRFAHIIDPRTGRPLTHDLASVTVLAPTTMQADALSTAMLVLGPETAMDFAKAHEIAAFLITGKDGAFSDAASPAFDRLLSA